MGYGNDMKACKRDSGGMGLLLLEGSQARIKRWDWKSGLGGIAWIWKLRKLVCANLRVWSLYFRGCSFDMTVCSVPFKTNWQQIQSSNQTHVTFMPLWPQECNHPQPSFLLADSMAYFTCVSRKFLALKIAFVLPWQATYIPAKPSLPTFINSCGQRPWPFRQWGKYQSPWAPNNVCSQFEPATTSHT